MLVPHGGGWEDICPVGSPPGVAVGLPTEDRFGDRSDSAAWTRHNGAMKGASQTTADPLTIDAPESGSATKTNRPWLVIVWNDPINLMTYVTFVLQKLFGYSREKATKLMLDVHHQGRAVVSSGSRERAELDVFRLHEHGLWATMEQSS